MFQLAQRGLDSQYFDPDGWYPQSPLKVEYSESVPAEIRTVAVEARGCLSVGHFRGAVALARAVVEATAKAKGITKGMLINKIDEMFKQGLIYEHVKNAAHEVREGGNEIAHGDLVDEPIDQFEAEAILELMDMVLDGVFIAPAKSAAQKAARLARKSDQQPSPGASVG